MENAMNVSANPVKVKSMHPQKFAMWLFIISVVMIFASLTSAYIVKKAEGDWLLVQFPELFKVTSFVIVLSSISIHLAYLSAKRDNMLALRIWLAATTVLAVAFVVGQYLSWSELVDQGVFFVGNAAGSFIYIFTGLHALHLIGGVVFLAIVLVNAIRYNVHSRSMAQIEMCTTYWHFLGGLWLYLYLFLILNN